MPNNPYTRKTSRRNPYTGRPYARNRVLIDTRPLYVPQQQGGGPVSGFIVQGKSATSYEHNFAQACNALGLSYEFQVNYFGGRRIRGGLVLDFMVQTTPLPSPVWIQGDYWHRSERFKEDQLLAARLDAYLQSQARPALFLWGIDTHTYDAALSAVRRYLL